MQDYIVCPHAPSISIEDRQLKGGMRLSEHSRTTHDSFVHAPHLFALKIDRQLKGGMRLSERSGKFCPSHENSKFALLLQFTKTENRRVGVAFGKEERRQREFRYVQCEES